MPKNTAKPEAHVEIIKVLKNNINNTTLLINILQQQHWNYLHLMYTKYKKLNRSRSPTHFKNLELEKLNLEQNLSLIIEKLALVD